MQASRAMPSDKISHQQVDALGRHKVLVLRRHKLAPGFPAVLGHEALQLGVQLDPILV